MSIPVIGIGAGAATDAQVLVMHDMLGMNPRPPRFVQNFMTEGRDIAGAFAAYAAAVRDGSFPRPEHGLTEEAPGHGDITMLICRTFAEIRDAVGKWRRSGESVVFVPTLNLHDGHLQLVELGARHGNRVVVSIFVNQLQFGRNEDYALYPRTLDADVEKLRSVGASALFCPSDAEVYPNGIEQQTTVTVPTMTDILCGATRPGHFTGVTTIVTKLFNIVQPDKAVFGMEDFQQLAVVGGAWCRICPADRNHRGAGGTRRRRARAQLA